jgi:hypothetical protein
MPASCKCCTHAESAELNKRLAAGGTNRSIAERFKVSTMSVQRHRVNCLRLPRKVEKSAAPVEADRAAGAERFATDQGERCQLCGILADDPDPRALIRRAERALSIGETIVLRAATGGDDLLALRGLDRVRSSLELLMKAYGMLGSEGGTVIDARTQIVAVANLTTDELRRLARIADVPPAGTKAVELPAIERETC